MDLNRVPNEQKLNLCRIYFIMGFLLLPFLWAVNSIWFFKEAFIKPTYPEQKKIRNYVIYSGILSTICLISLITWVIVFQLNRAKWGQLGDDLSFIAPMGRA